MKLWRVTLKGMNYGSTTIYGLPYVIAENSDEAYKKVRKYLDDKDLGFSSERELEKVEFLAETGDYPACKIQLFL